MLDLSGGRGVGDIEFWQQHGHDPDLNGHSVLEAFPYNRSCDDAGTPTLECSCSEMITEEHAPKSSPWSLVKTDALPMPVDHMNDELETHNLISLGVCRKLAVKDLLSVSSRPTATQLISYTL